MNASPKHYTWYHPSVCVFVSVRSDQLFLQVEMRVRDRARLLMPSCVEFGGSPYITGQQEKRLFDIPTINVCTVQTDTRSKVSK